MLSHSHDLRDDRPLGPVNAEYFRELPKILRSGLSNREDSVTKPPHAEITELLIEELDTQLAGKQRDVFDDGKADSPLLILSQLNNSGEKRLRKQFNANDYREVSLSARDPHPPRAGTHPC